MFRKIMFALVALVTIVLKGAAGYVTNSMGLISDAMESFVNLASATFALAMVFGLPAKRWRPSAPTVVGRRLSLVMNSASSLTVLTTFAFGPSLSASITEP